MMIDEGMGCGTNETRAGEQMKRMRNALIKNKTVERESERGE